MVGIPINLAELNGLVTPDKVAAQGFLRPNRVTVLRGTDNTGEEALYVQVVFPDTVTDKQLLWKNLKQMSRWIWQQLWDATDNALFPYVSFIRESEVS